MRLAEINWQLFSGCNSASTSLLSVKREKKKRLATKLDNKMSKNKPKNNTIINSGSRENIWESETSARPGRGCSKMSRLEESVETKVPKTPKTYWTTAAGREGTDGKTKTRLGTLLTRLIVFICVLISSRLGGERRYWFSKGTDWIWMQLTFREARVEESGWSPTYLGVHLNKSHCSAHMGPLINEEQNRLYFFRGGSDPLAWAQSYCALLIRPVWPAACFFGAGVEGFWPGRQTHTRGEKINQLKCSKRWVSSVGGKRKQLSRWLRRERHLRWALDK